MAISIRLIALFNSLPWYTESVFFKKHDQFFPLHLVDSNLEREKEYTRIKESQEVIKGFEKKIGIFFFSNVQIFKFPECYESGKDNATTAYHYYPIRIHYYDSYKHTNLVSFLMAYWISEEVKPACSHDIIVSVQEKHISHIIISQVYTTACLLSPSSLV